MDIQPVDPPGRPNRKLRAHLDVVKRLHEQGYSIEAIRKAFLGVGVVVGWTTVQREITKLKSLPATASKAASRQVRPTSQPGKEGTSAPSPVPVKPVNVDDFFAKTNDNPLFLRKKGPSP